MRLPYVFAVARAEVRSNRRLVLYWLYAVIAVAVGVGTYAQFVFLHGSYSGMSATVAAVGPRYVIAQVAVNLLIVFLDGDNQIRISPFWNPAAIEDADPTELFIWTLQNRIGFVLVMVAILALGFMRANRRERMLAGG